MINAAHFHSMDRWIPLLSQADMKELKRVAYGAGRTDHPLMSPSFFPDLERAKYLEDEAQKERARERHATHDERQPPASIEVVTVHAAFL